MLHQIFQLPVQTIKFEPSSNWDSYVLWRSQDYWETQSSYHYQLCHASWASLTRWLLAIMCVHCQTFLKFQAISSYTLRSHCYGLKLTCWCGEMELGLLISLFSFRIVNDLDDHRNQRFNHGCPVDRNHSFIYVYFQFFDLPSSSPFMFKKFPLVVLFLAFFSVNSLRIQF